MKSLKELREERAGLVTDLQAIDKKADEEKRDLSADEKTEWDNLNQKIDDLDKDIEREVRREEINKAAAAKAVAATQRNKDEKRLHNFSMLKAIRMAATGKIDGKEDGFYVEMHQEADNELRQSGVKEGLKGFGVPSIVLEKRDVTATGTTSVAGDQGGFTVATETTGFIDYLKDALVVRSLGANVMTGLVGNLSMPRGKTIATAAWEGENDDTTETSPTFDSVTASPNRLAAFTEISKQLMIQSSIDVEQYINSLLAYAVANKLEYAAITGTGSNDQPTGILNTTGIGSYSTGTNGGAPTYTTLIGLEKEVDIDNALMGKMGYLTNAKLKAKLKNTKLDAGSGLFLAAQDATTLNSYPAAYTNLVPSNLTKGTGTSLSALIFGNWNDLIMAQWGGLDITADATSLAMAKAGKVGVVINSYWDIIIRHAASFAACVDLTTDLT